MKMTRGNENNLSCTTKRFSGAGFLVFSAFLSLSLGIGCKAKPKFATGLGGGLGGGPANGSEASPVDVTGNSPTPGAISGADEPLSYPLISFKGQGSMTYNGNNYKLGQEVSAQMDKTNLVINTLHFSSSTGDVDKQVKKKVGSDTFVRVPRETLEGLAKSGAFLNETFVVFSMEVRKKDGKIVTFSSPVPAFIIPAKKNRYEKLDTGSISYNSNAMVDGVSVPVSFTISKGAAAATVDSYAVDVRMDIPSDKDGSLYENIPIPKYATYVVDTNQKIVSKLQTSSSFRNDKAKKREDMKFDYLPLSK